MEKQSNTRFFLAIIAVALLGLGFGFTAAADWSCYTACEPGWASCCTVCVDIDGCGDIHQAEVQCN